MTFPLLFQPIELRKVRAKNRIVVSPMCQYSASEGMVDDWHLVHLGKFAQGGAGIVFVEATAVESRGRITHGDVGLWSDAQIPGLARIAAFVRAQGAVPAIQLGHAGRKASMARPWYGNGPLTGEDTARGDKAWETVGPTDAPRERRRIRHRRTARGAWLPAAQLPVADFQPTHGPLWREHGKPHALSARGGARELAKAGIDVVDCSSGGISGSATAATKTLLRRVPGFQLPFAERVRRDSGLKTMAVGLILTPRQAEDALQAGRAEFRPLARAVRLVADAAGGEHAA